MFKVITEAFKKKESADPLTAATSHAIQENTAAAQRLKTVMCKVLDGPGCKCQPLLSARSQ